MSSNNPSIGSHSSGSNDIDPALLGLIQGPLQAPPVDQSQSTLSSSTAIGGAHRYEASRAMLPMPDDGIQGIQTPADLSAKFRLDYSTILCAVTDAWAKSVADNAKRSKEDAIENAKNDEIKNAALRRDEINSTYIAAQQVTGTEQTKPKGASQMEAYLTSLPIEDREKYSKSIQKYWDDSGFGTAGATSAINATNSSGASVPAAERSNSSPDLAGYNIQQFSAGSMAIGAAAIPMFSGVGNVSGSGEASFREYSTAWNQVSPVNANDMAQQYGGWFSAMWGIGLQTIISAQSAAETGSGTEKNPAKDVKQATQEALNTVKLVNGSQYGAQFMALWTAIVEKSPELKVQNPDMSALLLKAKVVNLSVALGKLYKAEVNTITGDEFASMLNGKMDLTKNDTYGTANAKLQVLAEIQNLLVQLPSQERVNVLVGLMKYFDGNPTFEDMNNQSEVYAQVFGQGDLKVTGGSNPLSV